MYKINVDVPKDTLRPPTTLSAKRSWVYIHFEADAEANKASCQVVTNRRTVRECGSSINRDKSGSTKNLNEHLTKFHNLSDPKKKDENNASILKYISYGNFLEGDLVKNSNLNL